MTESEKALALEHLGRMVKEGRYLPSEGGAHISMPVLHSMGVALESLKERKTGKWVIRGGIHNMYTCYACSECGRGIEMYYDFGNIPTDADVINEFPYCHCGAKMMEVDE